MKSEKDSNIRTEHSNRLLVQTEGLYRKEDFEDVNEAMSGNACSKTRPQDDYLERGEREERERDPDHQPDESRCRDGLRCDQLRPKVSLRLCYLFRYL